jgi:hypothetical protein
MRTLESAGSAVQGIRFLSKKIGCQHSAFCTGSEKSNGGETNLLSSTESVFRLGDIPR